MSDIPAGFRRLDAHEVFVNDTMLIVTGVPDECEDEESPDAHNCDAMGCGSVGPHVICRARLVR